MALSNLAGALALLEGPSSAYKRQLCYTNSTELLFAGMTIYHMRIIERLWGSSKFAVCQGISAIAIYKLAVNHVKASKASNTLQSFLSTIFPLTTLLSPALLALILRPLSLGYLNYLPAGPTAPIFALLAQYHAAIPHIYKYRVATSSSSTTSNSSLLPLFSDKSVTYLLAGQLALSQLPGSALCAAVGWGCGVAWRDGLLPVRLVEWRVPGWLVRGSGGRGAGRAGEGFEDLRRRLEGEGRASGIDGTGADGVGAPAGAGQAQARERRGWVGGIVDGIRGAF